MLAHVIPGCSALLAPFDNATGGCQSSEHIVWTESLRKAFKYAQDSLHTNKAITLPRPSDKLWLVTDGSTKQYGLGATLYVMRAGKLKLAGFFSAKLCGRQTTWLPCEIEALSIAAAVKHFSPYIVQSSHTASILTDSKPCAQAHEKLCLGEFSVSPRVSTFLSVVSRYQATANTSPAQQMSHQTLLVATHQHVSNNSVKYAPSSGKWRSRLSCYASLPTM